MPLGQSCKNTSTTNGAPPLTCLGSCTPQKHGTARSIVSFWPSISPSDPSNTSSKAVSSLFRVIKNPCHMPLLFTQTSTPRGRPDLWTSLPYSPQTSVDFEATARAQATDPELRTLYLLPLPLCSSPRCPTCPPLQF